MSARKDTYKIAHTARCKLQIAADSPDRNLRFILGHAFTLDKVMVRLAEIEVDTDSDSGDESPAATIADTRRISFSKKTSTAGGNGAERRRSPPPPQLDDSGNSDSEGEEDDDDEDDLSLTRFGSAAAHPRRDVEETEETINNPSNLSDEQLKAITEGVENLEMGEIFNHIAGCPCHGHSGQGLKAEKFWEVPGQEESGPRMAIVQVTA